MKKHLIAALVVLSVSQLNSEEAQPIDAKAKVFFNRTLTSQPMEIKLDYYPKANWKKYPGAYKAGKSTSKTLAVGPMCSGVIPYNGYVKSLHARVAGNKVWIQMNVSKDELNQYGLIQLTSPTQYSVYVEHME